MNNFHITNKEIKKRTSEDVLLQKLGIQPKSRAYLCELRNGGISKYKKKKGGTSLYKVKPKLIEGIDFINLDRTVLYSEAGWSKYRTLLIQQHKTH